jgi:hypothetical protein
VLSLIGTGSTISDAARSVGVHRNTIGNWIRSSPLFKDGLACAQYDQVLFWREHAQLLADSALQAIQQIIEDDRATPSTRLRAALAIFQMCRRQSNPIRIRLCPQPCCRFPMPRQPSPKIRKTCTKVPNRNRKKRRPSSVSPQKLDATIFALAAVD